MMLDGSIALSKVALTEASRTTPGVASAGFKLVTIGAAVSVLSPVVKVQTKLLASALPDRSVTPVVIVAV